MDAHSKMKNFIMTILDNLPNVIFAVLVLVVGCLFAWKFHKDKESKARCPNCGKLWAAEKIGERLIGVFRKAGFAYRTLSLMGMLSKDVNVNMGLYEKYEVQCQCKFCAHKWTFLISVKQ